MDELVVAQRSLMKLMKLMLLSALILIWINHACVAAETSQKDSAYPGEDKYAQNVTISDPIEPWNRAMYKFNDKFYFWVLKPVAKGYSFIIAEPGRVAIHNIYDNAREPISIVNNFLQLKVKQAGIEFSRFLINTTIGIAGIWDPAKKWCHLKPYPEDLGQTLGYYGLGYGFYIVWPFLGPSSVRDSIGYGGDLFLNPLDYINPFYVPYAIEVHRTVNETSLHIGDYEALKKAALDPYLAMRNAYAQHRYEKVNK